VKESAEEARTNAAYQHYRSLAEQQLRQIKALKRTGIQALAAA
jgi:hypothetical protein